MALMHFLGRSLLSTIQTGPVSPSSGGIQATHTHTHTQSDSVENSQPVVVRIPPTISPLCTKDEVEVEVGGRSHTDNP